MYEPLPPLFYAKPSVVLARQLIGKVLVHELEDGLLAARIVETEAYAGPTDRAAHSFNGRRTKRTDVMFGAPGLLYAYQMHTHTLINVVAAEEGVPEAVLLRAVEPIEGLAAMAQLRGPHVPMRQWTSGPGKLTKALGITMAAYGHPWWERPLYLADGPEPGPIEVGPRIGVAGSGEAAHYPYRFYEAGNPYVSKFRR